MPDTNYHAETAANMLELRLQNTPGIHLHGVGVGVDDDDASKPALFVYYRGPSKIARAKVPTVFHELRVTLVNLDVVTPARRSP